jgi:phosphoserine phosphatase
MIKAILHDFDGSLVTKDILDAACGIVGKEEESRRLNEEFQAGVRPGRESLIERINFLKNVSTSQIKKQLTKEPYLMPGAVQWLGFLKENKIPVILYSGNIEPILEYYQDLLDIDYIVGTKPKMEGDKIVGIGPEDFPEQNWKIEGIDKILQELKISPEDTLAVDDSIAGKVVFEYAGKSIAINPKGGIEKFATYTIENNLLKAIDVVKKEGLL